jgi:hypothetical protein
VLFGIAPALLIAPLNTTLVHLVDLLKLPTP